MGWVSRLLARRELAALALELLDRIQDAAEELADLRYRQGRPAEAYDLQDSLAKFREARRKASR